MKRIIALIICVMLLLTGLVACKKATDFDKGAVNSETDGSSSVSGDGSTLPEDNGNSDVNDLSTPQSGASSVVSSNVDTTSSDVSSKVGLSQNTSSQNNSSQNASSQNTSSSGTVSTSTSSNSKPSQPSSTTSSTVSSNNSSVGSSQVSSSMDSSTQSLLEQWKNNVSLEMETKKKK